MVLAGDTRPASVSEYYLVSEKMLSNAEVVRIAAESGRCARRDPRQSAAGVLTQWPIAGKRPKAKTAWHR